MHLFSGSQGIKNKFQGHEKLYLDESLQSFYHPAVRFSSGKDCVLADANVWSHFGLGNIKFEQLQVPDQAMRK